MATLIPTVPATKVGTKPNLKTPSFFADGLPLSRKRYARTTIDGIVQNLTPLPKPHKCSYCFGGSHSRYCCHRTRAIGVNFEKNQDFTETWSFPTVVEPLSRICGYAAQRDWLEGKCGFTGPHHVRYTPYTVFARIHSDILSFANN